MTTINRLSALDALASGDQLPVYSTSLGDARRASLSLLLDWIEANANLPGQQVTQYAAPSATGFSVTIGAGDVWLLLTPVAGYAAGTIVLPSDPADRDTVTVNCTQAVTTLTVSSGKTVTGAPTTLSANAFFTMRYDGVTQAWYRIG